MSEIGWIDFSQTDRNRLTTILDFLANEGIIDELGIGVIRDSIADRLFPGISTIQTRAKYFFIIPYIIKEFALAYSFENSNKNLSDYLEKEEDKIMWELADRYNHEDGHGVIGITKYKPHKLARRASTIYWNGIKAHRFINTKLSLPDYLSLEKKLRSEIVSDNNNKGLNNDDKDVEDMDIFNIKVKYDEKWRVDLNLELTPEEASFFLHRLKDYEHPNLLTELANNDTLYKFFSSSKDINCFMKDSDRTRINPYLRKSLNLAHDFNEISHGIHLLYNGFLQQRYYKNNDKIDEWWLWQKEIQGKLIDIGNLTSGYIFEVAKRTSPFTQNFINNFINEVLKNTPSLNYLYELVSYQEIKNKGFKARLGKNIEPDFEKNVWVGLDYLSYRFGNAKTILNDIKNSLAND